MVADDGRRPAAGGGRLYLSGVEAPLGEQFAQIPPATEHVEVVHAEPLIGESSLEALRRVTGWVAASHPPASGEAMVR